MTSKNAQCSIWCRFWIFKISCKNGVLKQSRPALFGSITHMTILFIFTCVMKYMTSIDSDVCHRPWSILWWIVRAYLLTTEYQVVQFVPSISISEPFESIHVTSLQQIHFFFFEVMVIDAWSRNFVKLLSCFCSPTHNIAPHISWHDLPCHRTTLRYEHSQSLEVFQFLPRKFAIQTWLFFCPQYLCSFYIVFECSPRKHDQRKMLVLPNQLLCWVLSTSEQCFASFQPIWCHLHTQIRITPFHGVRKSIPNWKPSPNRAAIGFSQIAFPITVLPKDDHKDCAQEERLGLPYWTMILAMCVVVDESKCLDIPISEFSVIVEHLPFLPGCKQILRPLLVHRNQAIWKWYPWS